MADGYFLSACFISACGPMVRPYFNRSVGGYITPNLDLSVQFHRSAPGAEWLLAEGLAEVAESGLVGFRSRVWSRGGRLLASGSGQLFCRPDPRA